MLKAHSVQSDKNSHKESPATGTRQFGNGNKGRFFERADTRQSWHSASEDSSATQKARETRRKKRALFHPLPPTRQTSARASMGSQPERSSSRIENRHRRKTGRKKFAADVTPTSRPAPRPQMFSMSPWQQPPPLALATRWDAERRVREGEPFAAAACIFQAFCRLWRLTARRSRGQITTAADEGVFS